MVSQIKRYFALGLAIVLSACSTQRGLEIRQAWTPPATINEDAAVYFTIQNLSGENDELLGASSSLTEEVEIHKSKTVNEAIQMQVFESVPVAAGQELTFEPGGFHVTLINIQQGLVVGEEFGITLHFKDQGDINIMVTVSDDIPADQHHDH